MATTPMDTIDADTDSRTATFERKRPHDVATQDDNSNSGSAHSTPRKRKKHAAKLGYQDVRDFVPNGGSFSTDVCHLEEGNNDDGKKSQEAAETGAAPSMNWNAVNHTKIRTSLGGGQGKGRTFQGERPQTAKAVDGLDEVVIRQKEVVDTSQTDDGPGDDKTEQDETNQSTQVAGGLGKASIAQTADNQLKPKPKPKPKAARKEATKIALARLEGFRDRLASMDPHDGPISAYKAAQVEFENAEVDYNYCLYHPSNTEFSPPPPKAYVPGNGNTIITKGQKYQIWELTKECMVDGTLQNLKEGKIPWGTGLKAQAVDLKQAENNLRHYGMSLGSDGTGRASNETSMDEVRDLRTDLNYCRHFPNHEEYLPLHRAKKGLLNPDNLSGGNGDLNRRAAQIWKLAQQCERDGTLEDLRKGKLDQCIRNVPAATQSFPASNSRAEENLDISRPNLEDIAGDIVTAVQEPEAKIEFSDAAQPEAPMAASHSAEVEQNGEVPISRSNIAELLPGPEATSCISYNDSESDEGLVLNTYEDDHGRSVEDDYLIEAKEAIEEFETNQADDDNGTVSDESDSTSDTGSDSDNGDDMMNISDSERQVAEEVLRAPELKAMAGTKAARTLAELSDEDLNAQLRYFHVTRTINEVDQSTPVRCLVCASEGHMADICEQLTCNVCGVFNHHITQKCPSTAKCSKCREMGHDKENCPYKLKHMAQNEIVCDLCQRNGHIEENCELQWRTSGRPWQSSATGRNVRLSCYECGQAGHLGNDCPTRRPGKSLGTSTWGSGNRQISIKSKGELSIKGTAKQPIDIDDGEEDGTRSFVRPKVPEPVRRGKILIKTGPKATYNDMGPNSGWNPINAPYNNGRANEPSYRQYQNDDRGKWQPNDEPQYDSYRQSKRRSRSPQYRDRGGYNPSDRYQPPAPRVTYQERRPPPPTADVYRPMPSSAQNAWRRHRV